MIAIYILIILALICIFVFTRHLWEKPDFSVDMMEKFNTIVQKGLSLGEGAKVLELRENFIKVGVWNHNGEKVYMVKQRPGNEFRVIYQSSYQSRFHDIKLQHVYPDSADQNEILAQFEKEIAESLKKR